MKKKKKKPINSLKDLKLEQMRLQLMEKALKNEILRESTAMVDRVKGDIYRQIGKTSDLVQLGLAGISLYQTLSNPKANHQADQTPNSGEVSNPQMGVSNWLEIATDVVKVIESR
ncbi:MAG: hypothetical protein Sapg2KO_53000 [Saprospiraceae bacterium]